MRPSPIKHAHRLDLHPETDYIVPQFMHVCKRRTLESCDGYVCVFVARLTELLSLRIPINRVHFLLGESVGIALRPLPLHYKGHARSTSHPIRMRAHSHPIDIER